MTTAALNIRDESINKGLNMLKDKQVAQTVVETGDATPEVLEGAVELRRYLKAGRKELDGQFNQLLAGRGYERIEEYLRARGANPFEVLVDLMTDEASSPFIKLTTATQLAKFIQPELKAVEINMNAPQNVQFTLNNVPLPANTTRKEDGE